MATQKCTKCGVVKSLNDFRTRRDVQGGRRAQCKTCMNAVETANRKRKEASAS